MIDLKSKAKAAFEHSKTLLEVFATSDGETFVKKTDAKLHASERKLDDKTITHFERADVLTEAAPAVDYKAMNIADLVTLIEASTEISHINAITEGDTRPEIVESAEERIKELESVK